MSTSLLNPENRFPNCLRMEMALAVVTAKLEGLIEIPFAQRVTPLEQVNILLDIRFGKHTETLPRGSVTFGLRRGKLKLKLDNGVVPLRNIELTDVFKIAIEVQRQEAKTGEPILQGLLKNTTLATINVRKKPCCIEATFYISKSEDICITDAEWLWQKNVNKKRFAILERGIIRRFLDNLLNLKPYLSRVELRYE